MSACNERERGEREREGEGERGRKREKEREGEYVYILVHTEWNAKTKGKEWEGSRNNKYISRQPLKKCLSLSHSYTYTLL